MLLAADRIGQNKIARRTAVSKPTVTLWPLQLGDGPLVYAAGEDVPRILTIPLADKRLLVRTIDVSRAPADVLTQITKLAGLIRSIAAASVVAPAAAS